MKMYSTHNEEKSVVAERFIKTLKYKIHKDKTSVSKNLYIDKLDDIVNKHSNTYHSTIKMKPVNIKSSTYINSIRENNDENSKFKIVSIVRISKYKNIFVKGYIPNWSEEDCVTKKVKNTVTWIYVISTIKGEEIAGTFTKMNYKKTNQKEFRVQKVIKRKGDKLYVKWKCYDNSFNSWIDKKDIV